LGLNRQRTLFFFLFLMLLSGWWLLLAIVRIVYSGKIPTMGVLTIAFLSVQDVAARIMAFSQQGPRAVCIISATGAISTATLHQDSDSGGVVTYEVCCCWLPFP
jgi:hypothetical protein